jgi:DnaJ-class molecular chaperone
MSFDGEDIFETVNISFEESLTGVTKKVNLQKKVQHLSRPWPPHQESLRVPTISHFTYHLNRECKGIGLVLIKHTQEVAIPQFVPSNTLLTFENEGNSSPFSLASH